MDLLGEPQLRLDSIELGLAAEIVRLIAAEDHVDVVKERSDQVCVIKSHEPSEATYAAPVRRTRRIQPVAASPVRVPVRDPLSARPSGAVSPVLRTSIEWRQRLAEPSRSGAGLVAAHAITLRPAGAWTRLAASAGIADALASTHPPDLPATPSHSAFPPELPDACTSAASGDVCALDHLTQRSIPAQAGCARRGSAGSRKAGASWLSWYPPTSSPRSTLTGEHLAAYVGA